MRLTLGELQQDRAAQRIDERMDFRGQPAVRTTHAMGSDGFF